MERVVSGNRATSRSLFALAAAAAAILTVAFVCWLQFRIGGDSVTTAIDDIGEAIAAFVASTSCAFAARRSSGRLRLAWWLIAASATSWGLGEVVWSVYEVGLGVDVPFPSAADAGFLAAIPLAVAGVLAFSSPPRGTSTNLRLWLDGLIVALSLVFVGWALGLSKVYLEAGDALVDRLISLAYPLGDIVIGTVLVLAIRRATEENHVRLLLLLGGLAANSMADSAFAYLTAGGAYGSVGSVLDTGWVIGYLLIALAAFWPSAGSGKAMEETPIDVWQLALPWMAVLAAGLSAVALALQGHPLDHFLTVVAGLLAVLLMVSQVFAHNEARSLLVRSRLMAATLNDVIVHAPLGVVRIDGHLNIIQANPGYATLLRTRPGELAGSPISRHFPDEEWAHFTAELGSLSSDSVDAVESDSRALRGDQSTIWLHWSATAVRNSDGEIDYYIAMFQDATSRHQAEAAAAANLNVLERLSRLKTEFLRMVSHEFRTALVGIQGFSELMRDTESLDVNEAKEFASEVYDNARRLDQMLDKMLDLDREAGSRTVATIIEINLNNAIRDAVAAISGEDHEHNVITRLEPGLPTVRGDSSRLLQLLAILLTNAIKYSPAGSEVTVSSRSEPGYVQISVRDRGVGMPTDFDYAIFARSQRDADNPTTKVVRIGLGLPMAREIVELHGGRIWFDSLVGAGSEFHFTIPIAARPRATGSSKR